MTAMIGRREFLGTAAAAGLLTGCKGLNQPGVREGSDLPKQLQGMAEPILAEYPENATILGIAKGKDEALNHRLTDRTPAGVAARAEGARKRLAALKALDLSDLGKPAHLDAAVARTAHEIAVEGFGFGFGDALNLAPRIGHLNNSH